MTISKHKIRRLAATEQAGRRLLCLSIPDQRQTVNLVPIKELCQAQFAISPTIGTRLIKSEKREMLLTKTQPSYWQSAHVVATCGTVS